MINETNTPTSAAIRFWPVYGNTGFPGLYPYNNQVGSFIPNTTISNFQCVAYGINANTNLFVCIDNNGSLLPNMTASVWGAGKSNPTTNFFSTNGNYFTLPSGSAISIAMWANTAFTNSITVNWSWQQHN